MKVCIRLFLSDNVQSL